MYAGKPEMGDGPYYIPNIDNVVKELVSKVSVDTPMKGKNLCMDRLYGSVPIVEWLLEEQKMTAVCTMRSDRLGMPEEAKDGKNREHLSNSIHYEKVCCCVQKVYIVLL